MPEHRRSARSSAAFPVHCECRGLSREVQAMNISRGGLLVTATEPLAIGAIVKLRFSIGEAETIELKGMVRHVSAETGCGVEFIEVLPHHQASLGEYLKKVSQSEFETAAGT